MLGEAATKKMDKEDQDILDKLTKLIRPTKKRTPGGKWDGRVSQLTLKEYRDMKWSADAGFNRTSRVGGSYTMRASVAFGSMLPDTKNLKPDKRVFVTGDQHKSMLAAKYCGPSYSMGCLPVHKPTDKSPGPAEYRLPHVLNPNGHPTIDKHTGARFGSEVLVSADATPANPGPGEYDVEGYGHSSVFKEPPKFSIAGREAWAPRSTAPGPSPGEYDFTKAMKNGKLSPLTWSMQGKTNPIEPPLGAERLYGSPAPSAYNPPGAPGCKYPHCSKERPPHWPMQREPRGLI
jgi:hypothetical protein